VQSLIKYIELPVSYSSYIRRDALEVINSNRHRWRHLNYHDLFRLQKNELLTLEGLDRFRLYSRQVDVFRVPPRFSGSPHIDKTHHAFNFILTNNGRMEWFDLEDLVETHKSEWGTANFSRPDHQPIAVAYSNMLWVNTKIPHRIVNDSDHERICISIRMVNNLYADKFTI
jgi:hypothetical protein